MGKKALVLYEPFYTVKPKNFSFKPGKIEIELELDQEDNVNALEKIRESMVDYLRDLSGVINGSLTDWDAKIEAMCTKVRTVNELQKVGERVKFVEGEFERQHKTIKTDCEKRAQGFWEKQAKENSELRTYKFKCAAKVALEGVKISAATAKLVVTGGAALTSYVTLLRSIVNIAKIVQELCKSCEKVLAELQKAIGEVTKKPTDKKVIADAETKLKLYAVKLTAVRQKADELSKELNKALVATEKMTFLPEVQTKQEKGIDEMIKQIIEFNEECKAGETISKSAKERIDKAKAGGSPPALAATMLSALVTAFKNAKNIRAAGEFLLAIVT